MGSLAGPIVIYVVFVPIAALLLLVTLLQRRKPKLLPTKLQTWEFLPELVRSLEPVDRLVVSCLTRWRKHKQGDIENDRWGEGSVAKTNKAFETDQTPV